MYGMSGALPFLRIRRRAELAPYRGDAEEEVVEARLLAPELGPPRDAPEVRAFDALGAEREAIVREPKNRVSNRHLSRRRALDADLRKVDRGPPPPAPRPRTRLVEVEARAQRAPRLARERRRVRFVAAVVRQAPQANAAPPGPREAHAVERLEHSRRAVIRQSCRPRSGGGHGHSCGLLTPRSTTSRAATRRRSSSTVLDHDGPLKILCGDFVEL